MLFYETAHASPPPPAMDGVIAALMHVDVAPQVRQNMQSAIRSLCRVLGRPPHLVSADMSAVRLLLRSASPGAARISPSRWRNVRSEVARALRLVSGRGLAISPAADMSAAWDAVAQLAPSATERSIIRRFARFCGSRAEEPADVGDTVIAAYRTHLNGAGLSKEPDRSIKDLLRIWNRLAGDGQQELRRLAVQRSDRCYTLPWRDLPAGLRADAAAYKTRSRERDWFDEDDNGGQVVRATTADQRDRMLRRLASAALKSGISASELNSLADLVRPEVLKAALSFMIARNNGEPNKQAFEMTLLALSIARHWAKLPAQEITAIQRWMKKLRPSAAGMTEKNRARLRQFTSGEVIKQLVSLPQRVYGGLAGKPVTPTTARRAQRALILAILTFAPIRLQNLRSLDRLLHFRRSFSTGAVEWQLIIPAGEVKNSVELQFPMPPHLMSMIDHYLAVYQPLLTCGFTSSLLFPGRVPGEMMSDSGMRLALTRYVKKQLGLTINPHLFRHIAALVFLTQHPGQYESVRQLLGHKKIQTTIDFYASFETDEAMRRFSRILCDLYAPDATANQTG